MKSRKSVHKRNRAQAMVEFAIALPVLLILLYGILETGRFLFIYSTVVTASRQAVRYGSATGIGDNGVPRYQDCDGIRASANRADFLNAFDHTGTDIVITYDNGPGTADFETCDGTVDTGITSGELASNSTRIKVTIHGDFFPLIPKLVPFIERSVANNNPIDGISARTILLSITIAVSNTPDLSGTTPTASNTPTQTPTITYTPTTIPTDTPTNTPSPTPLFTSTPSNTPTITFTPTTTFTPSFTPTPSNTPTPSFTPTASSTPIANCNLVTHGPLTIDGSTMSMTINNPTGVPLLVQDVTVHWNHDAGHRVGSDKTLRLIEARLGDIFASDATGVYAPSFTFTPFGVSVPTGSSTLIFTFHQSYTRTDNTERIIINFATNGCQNFPIDEN